MDKYFLTDAFPELWPEPERNYPYGMDIHPTVRCAKALSAYNREDMDEFLKHADWLVENQNPETGAWEFPFDYKVPGYDARAPWICCMTQGMGLSVMKRAMEESGKYRNALLKALDPFTVPVEDGGLLRLTPEKESGQSVWYEGIPAIDGAQILNEFMFSLIGLQEAFDGVLDSNPAFENGMRTLERHLPDFDLRLPFFKWSRYDSGLYFYAPPKYHWVHVRQLRWLAREAGSRVCEEYAKKWDWWGWEYRDSTGKYLFIRFWALYHKWLNWRYRGADL